MIKFIKICCVMLIAGSIFGQQPMQFTQHMFNKYHFNPAYAGMEYSLSVTAANRNQWSGLEGNPQSQQVNAHMPFYLWNGALGAMVSNETLGAEGRTSIALSYNFVLDTELAIFSLGARLGAQQFRINGGKLRTSEGVYEGGTIDHNDPILFAGSANGISPTYEIGGYFIFDQLEGGITVGNYPSNNVAVENIDISQKTYSSISVQYSIYVNDYLEIIPSLIVQSDFNQTQVNFAGLVKYDNRYYFGTNVRGYSGKTLDAVSLITGMKINRHYRISYAYDLSLSDLRNFSDGSHEFILNYNLNKLIGAGLPPKVIFNPRY